MRGLRIFVLSAVGLLICSSHVHAQNIEDMISKYTSDNGKGYVQPLADAFGANLNSGFYHHAKVKKAGFQLYSA